MITMVIPVRQQPNFLSVCLDALVRKSATRPRILVVYSDDICAGDFIVNKATDEREKRYNTVARYIKARGKRWFKANNIVFLDATAECRALRESWGDREGVSGADTALKNNLAYPLFDTPYVIPNWDADFIPSNGWDEALLSLAESRTGDARRLFHPVHCQPRTYTDEGSFPGDIESTRDEASDRLAFPTTSPHWHVDEADWDAFVLRHASDCILEEPAPGEGFRRKIHFLPVMYRTSELREEIGPYSLIGTGYDPEIIERAIKKDYRCLLTYRSWILHKGYFRQ
jgi:hypothetical protein